MSTGWSIFVTVITLGMLVGCWLLLALTRRSEVPDGEHVEKNHVFDGISELENPLPRWWYYAFVGTILFGFGYLILFPGLGNWSGTLGWSQVDQWTAEVEAADERYSPLFDRYAAIPIAELATDQKALRMGQRIFGNFCSQCHGTAAQGARGFPNLADDAWIWGGSPEAVLTSIAKGRRAVMPGWEAALGDDGIRTTTEYVLSLSGRATDADAVAAGAEHYASLCVACHGVEGKGNPLLGAPNLTDDAWIYGGRSEDIATTLRAGRNGVMPAQENLLDEARIHLVATWVWSLSQPAPDTAHGSPAAAGQ